MLLIDFETKSRCNLREHGAYLYAKDPSTDILCCAFVPLDVNDSREWLWTPDTDLPCDLRDVIQSSRYIMAHNAQFDRLIWQHVATRLYGFPDVPLDVWYCTSAQMRVNNLPASLENAAIALDSRYRKDVQGKQLIQKLSIPQKDGSFNDDPSLLAQMAAYCMKDVLVTRDIVRATRLMTQAEHSDWLVNERINDRGVMIDTKLARHAMSYKQSELDVLNKELQLTTDGALNTVGQTTAAAGWIIEQAGESVRDMFTKINDAGEIILSLDKNIREDALHAYAADELDLPDAAADVISIINDAGFSSIAKFKNMFHRTDPLTQRLNGAFVYAGASSTLRFSSMGLQIHNFPRASFETVDRTWEAYDLIVNNVPLDETMSTLKKLLRHAIMCRSDKWLIASDWTGIEARVLPWLADTPASCDYLDKLADPDYDVYTATAETLGFANQRNIGKTAALACGYGGGANAFKQFARAYRVNLPDDTIDHIVQQWRKSNQWAVKFWDALYQHALTAVHNPDLVYEYRRLRFIYRPELMDGTLWIILPDDSVISYPQIRVERDGQYKSLSCLNSSVRKKKMADEWPRMELYGGRLAGHVTQAAAGALLRNALRQLNNVVMHVHDEIIVECDEMDLNEAYQDLKRVMNTVPEWADGLPLEAECVVMERYRKA